jgi:hypothetical protein
MASAIVASMRGELALDGFDARVQAFGAGELGFGLTELSGVAVLHDGLECPVAHVLRAHLFSE